MTQASKTDRKEPLSLLLKQYQKNVRRGHHVSALIAILIAFATLYATESAFRANESSRDSAQKVSDMRSKNAEVRRRVDSLENSLTRISAALEERDLERAEEIVAEQLVAAEDDILRTPTDPESREAQLESAHQLVMAGKQALHEGDERAAVRSFWRARDLDLAYKLSYAEPYYQLGTIAFRELRWDVATIRYRQALRRDSRHIDARLGLARLFMLERRFDQAIEFVSDLSESVADPRFTMMKSEIRTLKALDVNCSAGSVQACLDAGDAMFRSTGRTVNGAEHYLERACDANRELACTQLSELRRDRAAMNPNTEPAP